MKIAIDISQIVYEGSGVSRYLANMVAAILKYDRKNEYVFFFSSLRRRLDHRLEIAIRNKYILKKYMLPPTLLDLLWNRLHIVPIDALTGTVDLMVTSDWTEPPSRISKITIVHDLVYLRFPNTLAPSIIAVQKRRLRWVKKETSHIIADSYSTKDDLIDLLHVPGEKITVIYPSVHLPYTEGVRTVHPEGVHKPFILTVGKIEPRKNIRRLIAAFHQAQLDNVELVIVGSQGWSSNQQSTMNYQQSNHIKFLGYVSDDKLRQLYQSALFFIYPSLYEGFGYPIVEAMSCGCPVAASNTSSLKEIAQDAALLFDPKNIDAIAHALTTLTNNTELRKILARKGVCRAAYFSEEKYAVNLLHVFDKVYDHRR